MSSGFPLKPGSEWTTEPIGSATSASTWCPKARSPRSPTGVPELMFEVVSPDKVSRERDYVRKRAEYHRFGVREYVIIDRFQRIVTVLSYAPNGYEERILTVDDTYESPLLPGFSIHLSEVF